ncbi:MAG TPA: Ig-like domain-containing protein [Actinomycetota bacterium]
MQDRPEPKQGTHTTTPAWRLGALVMIAASTLVARPAPAAHGPQLAFHSAMDGDAEIYVMNADGSGVEQLTDHAASDLEPAWSPDGTTIAFTSNRDGDYEIFVMQADGTGVRQLTFTDHTGVDRRPAWSPDGREVLFDRPYEWWSGRHTDLYAVSIDTGAVRRITNGFGLGSGGGWGDWSPEQRIVTMRHTDRNDWELATVDPVSLAIVQITSNSVDDVEPDWFPGGQMVAFASHRTGNRQIFTMNADGTSAVQLTDHAETDASPAVSCDGSMIAFISNRMGAFDIWTMLADGSQQTRLTTFGAGNPAWRCPTHPPDVQDDAYETDEDVALDVAAPGVLANDTDIDGDALTASIAAEPAGGTVELRADGSFTYVPSLDFNGTDSFTYRATDVRGMSSLAVVTITIAAVNDPPFATDDAATTPQYRPVVMGVLANDGDVDGDAITIVSVAVPAHGTASTDGATITYTPDHTFKGSDSFAYTIADPSGETAEATVMIGEDRCGEDGLDALAGTPLQGTASQTIDRTVEPAIGDHNQDAAEVVHEVNCAVIVPAEQMVAR